MICEILPSCKYKEDYVLFFILRSQCSLNFHIENTLDSYHTHTTQHFKSESLFSGFPTEF